MKVFGTLVLLIAFLNPVQNAVKLEYVFKVGDEYTMTQSMKQTMKQKIMGMEQNGSSSNAGVMKFKVRSLTATGAKIEVQFLKLKIASSTMVGEMLMDSEGPDNSENNVFKAMMNKPFYINMARTGKVERVEGDENLWSAINQSTADETTKAKLKILQQQFGKASLKNSIEQAMVQYTADKVKIGDTWTTTREFPMELPIQSNQTWKFVESNGSTAKVDADGVVITTDPNKAFTLPIGIQAKSNLKGKQAINAIVNSKTGWANNVTLKAELNGTMTLLAGGMLPMDMETPITILSETTYEVVKGK